MRIVALLDRANARSMTMRGFVAEDRFGTLKIYGIRGRDGDVLTDDRLALLIEQGDAIEVETPVDLDSLPADAAAWWVGDEFYNSSTKEYGLAPYFDFYSKARARGGRFGVDTAPHIAGALDDWIDWAFHRCIKTSNADIASLMARVKPKHVQTHAAIYWCAEEDEKLSELTFLLQIQGTPSPALEDVEKLQAVLDEECLHAISRIKDWSAIVERAMRMGVVLERLQGTVFAIASPHAGEKELSDFISSLQQKPGIFYAARSDPRELLTYFDLGKWTSLSLRVGRALLAKTSGGRRHEGVRHIRYLTDNERRYLDQNPAALANPSALERKMHRLVAS